MSSHSGRFHERMVRGFSLIEVAIAVFIIALVLGGILVPLSTQVEQRKTGETQKTLDDIRQALLGFALAYGYLPCPDMTTAGPGANDGQEDVNAGVCVTNEGNLPWATLGVTGYDSWGNRHRYRVHPSFSQRAPATLFTLSTTSNLQVCADQGCGTSLTTVTDGPPAVVLSHGKNGYGAINSITNTVNPAPTSLGELANTNGTADTIYVSHTQSDIGSTTGEFDDNVVWLSREILLNRMVAGGRLP
ncbi:MAG: type II secretion system protein [Burkholderiales bacterium]